MLAVIKTGGKQYKVAPGEKIKVEKLEAKEGEKIVFDEVLLIADENNVEIGAPFLKGAKVTGNVVKHDRHDKVIIFKYKPKKRYRLKKGHKQPYTEVEIVDIKN
ncbi:MAG: 50S ribosomal protein L21 [Candidatus Pacebacteria bacterium]|nr:50S ribosomal protein L21 [Candidatus Paceibacterota bacterium]